MSKRQPLVSIGIPTYNRADMLSISLDSVLSQDYENTEIIISDNASTDSTSSVCKRYCDVDNRVKYFKQTTNLGPTANFEQVLKIASGEFFMWLGDDDWIDDNYISTCVEFLSSNTDFAHVSGLPKYYCFDKNIYDGQVFSLSHRSWMTRVMSYYNKVTDNGMFYGLMRTATIQQVKIHKTMGSDWHVIAQVVSTGKSKMLDVTHVHRQLGGATTSYKNIAESLGLSKWQAYLPMTAIAVGSWAEIFNRGELYKDKNIFGRFFVASVCALLVIKKSLFNYLSRLKKRALTLASNSKV